MKNNKNPKIQILSTHTYPSLLHNLFTQLHTSLHIHHNKTTSLHLISQIHLLQNNYTEISQPEFVTYTTPTTSHNTHFTSL